MTNLPEPSFAGVLTLSASSDIDAPIDKVWDVLTAFPSYSEWNPFVRSQVLVDASGTPLPDQTPRVGLFLSMQTHIPPSMDPTQKLQPAHVVITAVDEHAHRLSWRTTAWRWLIHSERWQALSVLSDGRTRYESREVFRGLGAWVIRWFLRGALQRSFDAMAEGVKARAEQLQQ